MIDLARRLDIILEDGPDPEPSPHLDAHDLVKQLQDARQTVLDIEHRLGVIRHRLSADLALGIRRAQPGLNVGVDKNGCKVGYKTKQLHFIPDVENGIWKVASGNDRFRREFLNNHRRSTLMGDPNLVQAIVAYFQNYYRSLNEEVTGTGRLLVEDRNSTLLGLVAWRDRETRQPLRTRLNRGLGRD
jgi:hypothetical protein